MENKSAGNRPFLYIVQPDFETGQSEMQEYVVKKNKIESSKENSRVIKIKKEDVQEEQVRPSFSATKHHFQNLSLKERVDFLLSIPKNDPQIPCVIQVNEQKYEGVLLHNTAESLSFQQKETGQKVELLWAEVNDVQML